MKKVVCCAAVVFGMMETSQGMKIECNLENKGENKIGRKMKSNFDWGNKEEIAGMLGRLFARKELHVSAPIKQYIIDAESKQIYDAENRNKVVQFCDETEAYKKETSEKFK